MKKILPIIILVFSLSVMLSACSLSPKSKNDFVDTGNKTEETVEMGSFLRANDLRAVSSKEGPVLKTSFRDDEYHYFLFDLGTINNVPLEGFSNMIKHESNGRKTTHALKSSPVESTSITNTLSDTIKKSINLNSPISVKMASEVSANDIFKTAAEYAYSSGVSLSQSQSYTESYSNASNFSKTNEKSVIMNFDENTEDGYYGYILTGAIEVYAMVARDILSNTYIVDYFSNIKQYWIDFYFLKTPADFVNYSYETIPFILPSESPTPTTYKSFIYDPIVETMSKYNCNDGNHYNKSEIEESADWRSRHNGFELGELILYGCSKTNNGYSVGDPTKFSIKYHVLHNTEDLPRVGTQETKIFNDTEANVIGTNIGSAIGHGAYWVRITYSDDTQTQYNATNQFQKADSNTYIELIDTSKINTSKELSKIEVVVAYELFSGGPGFLGIWWKEYSNWRCEYTYNFVK